MTCPGLAEPEVVGYQARSAWGNHSAARLGLWSSWGEQRTGWKSNGGIWGQECTEGPGWSAGEKCRCELEPDADVPGDFWGDRLSQRTEETMWKAPCHTFFSVTSKGNRRDQESGIPSTHRNPVTCFWKGSHSGSTPFCSAGFWGEALTTGVFSSPGESHVRARLKTTAWHELGPSGRGVITDILQHDPWHI